MTIHTLSSGRRFASPFRVPRLRGAMLYGTVDGNAAEALLAPDGLSPVRTTCGRGLGCLWLSDFLESTVGPYRELTVTLLVAERPLSVRWINGYTPLAAQLRPEALVCEYALILDNPDAIDYGRELHGFDKRPGALAFDSDGAGRFRFAVSQEGARVVEGRFTERGVGAMPSALAQLARAHGAWSTVRLLAARTQRLRVITPRTVRQLRSDLFFRGVMRLQPWLATDELTFGDAPVGRLLAQLRFQPTAVQRVLAGAGLMPLPLPLSC